MIQRGSAFQSLFITPFQGFVLRPFTMGYTHRWHIMPFQGLLTRHNNIDCVVGWGDDIDMLEVSRKK